MGDEIATVGPDVYADKMAMVEHDGTAEIKRLGWGKYDVMAGTKCLGCILDGD